MCVCASLGLDIVVGNFDFGVFINMTMFIFIFFFFFFFFFFQAEDGIRDSP